MEPGESGEAVVGMCDDAAHASREGCGEWPFASWAIGRAMDGEPAALIRGAAMLGEDALARLAGLALDAMIEDEESRVGGLDALLGVRGAGFYSRVRRGASVTRRLVGLCKRDGGLGESAREVLGRVARANRVRTAESACMYDAIKSRSVRALEVLVAAGVTLRTRTPNRRDTPAHVAARMGKLAVEMLRALSANKEEFEWSMRTESGDGDTPIEGMVRSGASVESVRAVLGLMDTAVAADGHILVAAAQSGRADVFCALVEEGLVVTFDEETGVLHEVAAQRGEFIEAVAEMMRDRSASVQFQMMRAMNGRNERGLTAVGVAMQATADSGDPSTLDSMIRLVAAVDPTREFFRVAHHGLGELSDAARVLGDDAVLCFLRTVVAVGYDEHTVASAAILSAAMSGRRGAVRYLASIGEWEILLACSAAGETVMKYVAEWGDVATLEELHATITAGAGARMAEAEAVLRKASDVHDLAMVHRFGGRVQETSFALQRALRSEMLWVGGQSRLVHCGAFEAVATQVASTLWVGVEEGTWRTFVYLERVGASLGKYTEHTVSMPYFASAFASDRILGSIPDTVLMRFMKAFCDDARDTVPRRRVDVHRAMLQVGLFFDGRGGLAGVNPKGMRLAGDEGLAYGRGAALEAMGAVFKQLVSETLRLFLPRGDLAAFGLVPNPDADGRSLVLLGWVVSGALLGNFTLGEPGVSPAVLLWMLGVEPDGARDLPLLSASGSCQKSLWSEAYSMTVEDWLASIGPVAQLLDEYAVGGMIERCGEMVTLANFDEIAGMAAHEIRELLGPALGSMRCGFETGLCGGNAQAGLRARLMMADAIGRRNTVGLWVNGLPRIDVKELRERTTYQGGYDESSETIGMFWRVVEGLAMPLRLRLFKFWTGRSAPAASGIRSESLTINLLESGAGGTRLLPVARTCFAELGVSMYARTEIDQLRSDIHMCIEHADEMGNL
jgi:hypothetical protein